MELEAEVEPDAEKEGEGEENVDVMRRLQERKYQTPCNLTYFGG